MRVFFFALCLWSDHSGLMALFCGFNLWSVPVFISGSCVSFKFSYSHFPVYTRGLDPFSGAYFKQLRVSVVHSDREQFDLRGPPA
jgi:hypothetical protein